jgi:hypothetical protein
MKPLVGQRIVAGQLAKDAGEAVGVWSPMLECGLVSLNSCRHRDRSSRACSRVWNQFAFRRARVPFLDVDSNTPCNGEE